ncbi:MAG: hypothetical protein AAGA48_29475, partial [Myxococcota bacterium]
QNDREPRRSREARNTGFETLIDGLSQRSSFEEACRHLAAASPDLELELEPPLSLEEELESELDEDSPALEPLSELLELESEADEDDEPPFRP